MSRVDVACRILLCCMLIAFLLSQWGQLGNSAWKYDEGINAMKAELVRAGYGLYEQIWSDQPPLFTLLLAGAFSIAGRSIAVGRLLVLLLALLGIAALSHIVRQVAGPVGMLASALMLLLFPHFRDLSRLLMIGLPAISLGVLALRAAFHHHKSEQQRWLVVAGLLLGLSLLIKPLTAPFYLPLCALALLPASGHGSLRPSRIRAWAWLSLAAALPLLMSLLFFTPRLFLTQVVGTYGDARQVDPVDVSGNAEAMWAYFAGDKYGASHFGPLLLAVGALLGLLVRRKWHGLWPLGLWLLSALLALLFQNPLRRHQLLLLAFPVMALAGVGVQEAVEGIARRNMSKGAQWQALLGVVTALFLVVAEVVSAARVDIRLLNRITFDQEEMEGGREAVAFLEAHTPAGSTIITDDPMLAFRADRRIPPQLAVPSARRLEAGNLSGRELIALSEENRPSAVLLWEERLRKVPGYMEWLMGGYCLVRAYPDGRYIYLPFDSSMIAYPQPSKVGEGIIFLGSQLDHLAVEAGDQLSVTLYWRAEAPVRKSLISFVHLIDSEGKRWGQVDREPFGGNHPTDRWQPGQVVADTLVITVRADAPSGEMLLAAGFYDPATGERLPVTDEAGNRVPGDQIYLAPRPVVRWEGSFGVPDAIQYPLRADLGEGVRLLGYDLDSTVVRPGQAISFTLYWQGRAEMRTSHTVFTHLLDGDGRLVAQRDQIPGAAKYPTTGWRQEEVIVDQYQILVPEELPAGVYQLTAGMYDTQTGERLPASDPGGQRLPEDRINLGEIEVRGD